MKLRSHTIAERRRFSGYTLLEVMLAVVIVLVIASLVSTPVMRSFRDNRLANSAESVRIVLAGSRLQSVDHDEDWQFRYEPGGTHYVRVPWTQSATTSAQNSSSGRQSGVLPDGVQFSVSDAGGGSLSPELLADLPDAGQLGGVSWSAPVLFFPDGTSTSAFFEIRDAFGGVREISVRDLTGSVSVKRPAVSGTQ